MEDKRETSWKAAKKGNGGRVFCLKKGKKANKGGRKEAIKGREKKGREETFSREKKKRKVGGFELLFFSILEAFFFKFSWGFSFKLGFPFQTSLH